MALTFKVNPSAHAIVLYCEGVIIFGDESSALRSKVKELMDQSRSLVLDLGGVHYVDSSGLGVIVGAFTTARAAGGDIKLSRVNQRVRHVLEITRLLPILGVYDDIEPALRALENEAAA